MIEVIKHYMNPLHLYCRLRDLGISKGRAIHLCKVYEQAIFRIFRMKG